jgi:hypothetical protein
MALYYSLPVYRDVYSLILIIYEITTKFSKDFKYSLGQDMKRDSLILVRDIYRANKTTEKRVHLENFLDNFEILKLELRLCTDLKLITIKKQSEISLLIENIGKQITGWKNSST